MHWIETMLGFSPDGGTGTSELLYAAAAASVALALLALRSRRHAPRKDPRG